MHTTHPGDILRYPTPWSSTPGRAGGHRSCRACGRDAGAHRPPRAAGGQLAARGASWHARGLVAVVALAVVATFVSLVVPPTAVAQEALVIKALAEKRVSQLPAGPLVWRIETFPTLAVAQAAAEPTGLAAESSGQVWLFTLGPRGGASPGGTRVAEIGPVPIPPATTYLLRINESSGAPGSVTPVHTHPGSEAFYVLAGEQSLHTASGVIRTGAGGMEIGLAGGTPLQVSSSGTTDLRALIMFVVDADQPFSSPATLPTGQPHVPGMPHTGMGGVGLPLLPAVVALVIGGGLVAGAVGGRLARRFRRGR